MYVILPHIQHMPFQKCYSFVYNFLDIYPKLGNNSFLIQRISYSFFHISTRVQNNNSMQMHYSWTIVSIPLIRLGMAGGWNLEDHTFRIWQNQGQWIIFVNSRQYHMTQMLFRESNKTCRVQRTRVAQWIMSLDLTAHTSLSLIRVGSRPAL